MDNAGQPVPPKPPELISNRRLNTYKIILLAGIVLLLICLLFISLYMKNKSKGIPTENKKLMDKSVFQE